MWGGMKQTHTHKKKKSPHGRIRAAIHTHKHQDCTMGEPQLNEQKEKKEKIFMVDGS